MVVIREWRVENGKKRMERREWRIERREWKDPSGTASPLDPDCELSKVEYRL
jgi:hypothetical protein